MQQNDIDAHILGTVGRWFERGVREATYVQVENSIYSQN